MSVRKGDRTSGKLEVLNCISVLSSHTIRMCRSEKVFPKSSRWIMAKPIVDECVSAFTCVRRANAVLVKTEPDYEYRRSQQIQAQAVCDVIDSFEGDIGIGLGSQISQLVELAVLDDLDHYIKERLRIKHYLRYMDDFVLIHPDKSYLQECRKQIGEKVQTLGLELNEKTTLYPLNQGVRMMNWRFVIAADTGRILRYMNGKKLGKQRRKMKKLMAKERAGLLAEGTTRNSFIAWRANAKRGDTFYQRQRMEHYFYDLKGRKEP